MNIETIIFDFGGVLIDWQPDFVYDTIFQDKQKKEWFYKHVCTGDWNENQDAGYPIAKATEEKVAEFPEWETEIRAFYGRWEEMLGDSIEGTVELLQYLKKNTNYRLIGLTNWSAETFPIALEKFDFLQWFEGIIVSGIEKTRKPFPEIYELTLSRYQIEPSRAIFIDDNARNVKAASDLGIKSIHFSTPAALRKRFQQEGII